ncbi:MAG TPA: glycine cleavage system aminomethyltransferase GcvT [Burkholderiaceae bacterium]
MLKRTVLYDTHVAAGARMVDFGGWEMPLHYGSQIEEHLTVRRHAGIFDVSHMRVVDINGPDACAFLRHLLTADIDRRGPDQAMYCCMLDERGGVLDDLIVYRWGDETSRYRAVLNAATADRDLQWMQSVASERGLHAECRGRTELAIIALQGPGAPAVLQRANPLLAAHAVPLAAFTSTRAEGAFVARTGYTGEDGFEIVVPGIEAPGLWRSLLDAGAAACGLGARDTLRLEAGMALYGHELDQSVTPLESGLAWTIDMNADRAFIGRQALERQRSAGPLRQLLGLKLLEKGVLRAEQAVHSPHGEGRTTSGGFSPTLQRSIALARVPAGVRLGETVNVQLRSALAAAQVVKPRFVRHGKALV